MSKLRRRAGLLVLSCSFAAAAGAAILGVWWLVRPSQVVVELTRYAYVWLGLGLWLCGLVGLLTPRGRWRRANLVLLAAGVVIGLLLWSGPGSVTAQSDAIVENASGQPLTDVVLVVAGGEYRAERLAAGERWSFALAPDVDGRLRLSARDSSGGLVSMISSLLTDQPDRLHFRFEADGRIELRTRTLWSRLSPVWD